MPDDVVIQKLVSIDRCLASVRRYVADDLGRLEDSMVLDAVVLNLQRACELAIDAACREVSRRGLGVPTDSADAFTILERESVLSPTVAERMRRMVGFRNVAVHEYRSLDPAIVRSVVEHRLGDFEALCRDLVAAS
ncbi:MAG: type VII toxin-antitoxin system HepT family RNase toxin [Planctomycetia bacterium]